KLILEGEVMKFSFLQRLLLRAAFAAGVSILALPVLAQSAARPQVPLPEGPVRSIILKNCVSCHGIDDYAFHAMDRASWETMIDQLHPADQRSLRISKGDKEILLDYLA